MHYIVLFAHGSPVEEANETIARLARQVEERRVADFVLHAFLAPARPTVAEAFEAAAVRGATRITVMPYFLTLGVHLRRDLPALIDEQRRRFPRLEIRVAEPLESYPGMVDAVVECVRAAGGDKVRE